MSRSPTPEQIGNIARDLYQTTRTAQHAIDRLLHVTTETTPTDAEPLSTEVVRPLTAEDLASHLNMSGERYAAAGLLRKAEEMNKAAREQAGMAAGRLLRNPGVLLAVSSKGVSVDSSWRSKLICPYEQALAQVAMGFGAYTLCAVEATIAPSLSASNVEMLFATDAGEYVTTARIISVQGRFLDASISKLCKILRSTAIVTH